MLTIGQLSIKELTTILGVQQEITPTFDATLQSILQQIKILTKAYWDYVGHREWTMPPRLACNLETNEGLLRLVAAKVAGLRQIRQQY